MSDKGDQIQQNWLEKADKWYVKNPAIRALMQILGVCTFGATSALDAGLVTHIQNMRDKRLQTFFEQLDEGEVELTEDVIQSEDFLHAYFATAKAALNTRRDEKIKLFANMLKSNANKDVKVDIDEYEEYLSILDELSYREIVVLSVLHRYEGDQKRFNWDWNDFTTAVNEQINIPTEEVELILTRTVRTGCVKAVIGVRWQGRKYQTTPVYNKLKRLIT